MFLDQVFKSAVFRVGALSCLGFTWTNLTLVHYANAATATRCPGNNVTWVQVTVDAPESPTLANKLLEYLRAELAPHQIGVCTSAAETPPAPLAVIHIVHSTANQVGIEVEVEDSITNKHVARQLDLRGVPQDAHAMTIALGAAELLRASWAEVKLRGARSSSVVPNSVTSTVDEAMTPSPTRATLGVHVAGEEFSDGLHQAGVDATAILQLIDAWQGTLRLGARQVFSVAAKDGVVRANSWILGAGLLYRMTPPDARASVALTGRIDAMRLQFVAEPKPNATSTALAATAWAYGFGVMGALRFNPLAQLEAEVDAGGVMRGVSAKDGAKTVVAMNGAWVGASIGLGVRLW